MLNFFPVAHRANSSQHLYSLGHMYLNHCGTVFRDHTTAGHENLSLEDDSRSAVIVVCRSRALHSKLNPALTYPHHGLLLHEEGVGEAPAT